MGHPVYYVQIHEFTTIYLRIVSLYIPQHVMRKQFHLFSSNFSTSFQQGAAILAEILYGKKGKKETGKEETYIRIPGVPSLCFFFPPPFCTCESISNVDRTIITRRAFVFRATGNVPRGLDDFRPNEAIKLACSFRCSRNLSTHRTREQTKLNGSCCCSFCFICFSFVHAPNFIPPVHDSSL